ncbi:MAG: NAD(P)-dependent oxidoreductase, partial [Actinobacteria bacterium]|nr:NAD(P)-dependent oxidoreductase [Actinomycetota bacterium]
QLMAELIGTQKYGLYHMTNTGSCSWFDFANEIFRLSGLSPNISPVTSEEFGARAKRPAYSVLDNAHLRAIGLLSGEYWKEALKDYIDHRAENKK